MDGKPSETREITARIASELSKAIAPFEPDIDLQTILGSYGDTLPDNEILSLLQSYNAGHGIFSSVTASADPSEMRSQIKLVEQDDE